MNTAIERNEDLQKAIFNFTWDRLESIKDGQVEGYIESQKNIDQAIEKIKDMLSNSGVKNIDMLLDNLADAFLFKGYFYIIIIKVYK